MNEVTLRNESLGLSMTKATINGTNVVLAENVREALEWDSVPHMVRELKDGKEVLKMRISDLDSAFKELLPNLAKTSEKSKFVFAHSFLLFCLLHPTPCGTYITCAALHDFQAIFVKISEKSCNNKKRDETSHALSGKEVDVQRVPLNLLKFQQVPTF